MLMACGCPCTWVRTYVMQSFAVPSSRHVSQAVATHCAVPSSRHVCHPVVTCTRAQTLGSRYTVNSAIQSSRAHEHGLLAVVYCHHAVTMCVLKRTLSSRYRHNCRYKRGGETWTRRLHDHDVEKTTSLRTEHCRMF